MLKTAINRFFAYVGFGAGPKEPQWHGGDGTGLLTIDNTSEISVANDPAVTIFGIGALDGCRLGDLIDDRAHEQLDAVLRADGALSGPIAVSTITPRSRDLDLYFEKNAKAGFNVLVMGRLVDDSALADLQEQIDDAKDAEKSALDQASASTNLLADLSHEMRTPLNAVIGFAEAMQNQTFGPIGHEKYAEYAGLIQSSGTHLMDLISSILDLSKANSDHLTLRPELVDLGAITSECVAMVKGGADEAGLSLSLNIEEELKPSWLDARAVRQILLNLLSNAVKFTSDGGINIEVAQKEDVNVITVADTGVGMNADEISRLGSRFTSVHGDGVRGAKGSGLGLALAFALAEAHQGKISLQSAPGEGVKATVTLPASQQSLVRPVEPVKTEEGVVHSQLDRIEAYRKEIAAAKKNAA